MADIVTGFKELIIDAGHELAEDVKREIDSVVGCIDERTEDVIDATQNVKNVVGAQVDGLRESATCGLRKLLNPDEMDEEPTAEILIRNPISGELISLGCKLSITEHGQHVIHNIQSGSFAHKLNLKESDVLFQVDEERVNMWSLGKVIQYLAKRGTTFTLVLKRKKPNTNDEYVYLAIRVKLSFDGDEIEAEIAGCYYLSPTPVYGAGVELEVTGYSFNAYVYQEVNNVPSRFVNIQMSTPYVTTIGSTTVELYKFRTHQLRGWERTVFVFDNVTVNKAIHAPSSTGYASLTDQASDDFESVQNSSSSDFIADGRMFYVHTPSSGYYQYESVIHAGSFLASENGRLVLSRNSSSYNTWFKTVNSASLDPTPQPSYPNTKPNIIHKHNR